MAGKSDALENSILDHVFGGSDYSRLSTVYVALLKSAPTDSTASASLDEDAYWYRTSVTNNSTNWPASVNGVKSNGQEIVWAPRNVSAGPFTHFAIMSSATNLQGTMLFWGSLSSPVTITTGNLVTIPAGGLVITED